MNTVYEIRVWLPKQGNKIALVNASNPEEAYQLIEDFVIQQFQNDRITLVDLKDER